MKKGFFVPRKMAEKVVDVMVDALHNKKLNFGLFFDKYVLWWYDDREKKWECNPEIQISLLRKVYSNPQEVKELLDNPNILGRKFREKMSDRVKLSIPHRIPEEYKFYRDRVNQLLNTLEQMGFHIEYLPDKQSGLPLNWRLAINLGAASVYETSLLFHRNYSIPYIPGSAVKGVTRHWTILKFADEVQKSKSVSYEEAIKEVDKAFEAGKDLGIETEVSKARIEFKELIEIFGTQNQKGKVIFFDALPIIEENKDFIVLDVMNVHYGDYYKDESGKTAPGDWMNPNPVFFLAVEKGTKFRFALASKDKNLAKKALELLKEALKNVGIGAKTSAGYGYFEV